MVVNCEWEDSSFHPSVFALANTRGMEKKRAPPIPGTDHCRQNMGNAVHEVGACSAGDSPAGRVRSINGYKYNGTNHLYWSMGNPSSLADSNLEYAAESTTSL